jgi:hypothetical protein
MLIAASPFVGRFDDFRRAYGTRRPNIEPGHTPGR